MLCSTSLRNLEAGAALVVSFERGQTVYYKKVRYDGADDASLPLSGISIRLLLRRSSVKWHLQDSARSSEERIPGAAASGTSDAAAPGILSSMSRLSSLADS